MCPGPTFPQTQSLGQRTLPQLSLAHTKPNAQCNLCKGLVC